jgi:CHASE2 domain-containing sensor protein/serine phosphatase RsbU (regulator of sigma subunit)
VIRPILRGGRIGDRARQALLKVLVSGHGRPLGTFILLLFLVASLAPAPPLISGLQFALFDAYQRLAPRKPTSAHAVIVAIDQKSLAQLGQWPWPRTVMAELIRALGKIGPAAIGVDVLMPEPDRMSPGSLAGIVERLDPELSRRLAKLPSNDSVLAEAFAHQPVALGVAGASELESGIRTAGRTAPFRVYGDDPTLPLRTFAGALRSLEQLDAAASGHGLISVDPGEGIIRSVPMFASVDGVLTPALSLETLRLASGNSGFSVTADHRGVRDIRIGDLVLPTDEDGSIWVHFSPHDPARFLSAVDVIRERVDPQWIEGKIVLIGATGIGLLDYKATPLGEQIPGVEIHAQILEGIFEDSLLRRPDFLRWFERALVAACGVLLIVAIPMVKPRLSAVIYVGLMAALSVLGFALYYWQQLLLSIVLPAGATNVLFGVMLSGTLIEADRQRRALRSALDAEREAAAHAAGELEAARRIQMGMLPPPSAAFYGDRRFSLQALIEPAKSVGGDLYDFFKLSDDHLFFMVGDVAGKGLPASIFMAVSKALYKSAALRSRPDTGTAIGEVMRAANDEIARDNPEMLFVTIFAGILDLRSGDLNWCNAGHDSPFCLRPGRIIPAKLYGEAGPPLCVVEGYAYRPERYRLLAGEALCLFTDGVTEAMNAEGELYGRQRLLSTLNSLVGLTDPLQLVNAIRDDVRAFVLTTERSDDLTILVLRWNGGEL